MAACSSTPSKPASHALVSELWIGPVTTLLIVDSAAARNSSLPIDFVSEPAMRVIRGFDVIFCRNVAIYFTERDRISLFGRMERALEPNGCLIIGAMESLNGLCPQFESMPAF